MLVQPRWSPEVVHVTQLHVSPFPTTPCQAAAERVPPTCRVAARSHRRSLLANAISLFLCHCPCAIPSANLHVAHPSIVHVHGQWPHGQWKKLLSMWYRLCALSILGVTGGGLFLSLSPPHLFQLLASPRGRCGQRLPRRLAHAETRLVLSRACGAAESHSVGLAPPAGERIVKREEKRLARG